MSNKKYYLTDNEDLYDILGDDYIEEEYDESDECDENDYIEEEYDESDDYDDDEEEEDEE